MLLLSSEGIFSLTKEKQEKLLTNTVHFYMAVLLGEFVIISFKDLIYSLYELDGINKWYVI